MDAADRAPRSAGPRGDRPRGDGVPRWLILAGVAVVLLFMAAMVTQYARTSNATAAADEARGQLALARAEATLAVAALEAERGSHQAALGQASSFFTQLQSRAGEVPPALRQKVSSILAQRDLTIALLSRGDAQSAQVLYRLLTEYRSALGQGATATPPASGRAP